MRHVAQRLFTLGQTNTVLFRFTQRDLKETTGGFTTVTTCKRLHKIARLNIAIGDRQGVLTRLTRTATRLNSHFFRDRIIGHFITRQTDRSLDVIQTRIFRVFKDHNIAAFGMTRFDQGFLVNRIFNTVGKFLNQNKVTDQQRRHHRT
ncbi:hypothetical protein SDC9_174370 [bioreactor metagenome]|uniref:Uncharacterized protein n=1 Tax=bioreactor metagenome TaxID=1076179 RepID=A0A645GSG2_9ZZZZ